MINNIVYLEQVYSESSFFNYVFISHHGRLSPSAQHRVVYRKMCRRFPVVLQEIRKIEDHEGRCLGLKGINSFPV